MAFIRPYKPEDFEDVARICRATLPPSLARSPSTVFLAPYLWAHQYTYLSPQTCFVLDDSTGKAVGYVVGTPSIPSFVASYASYISAILTRDVTPAPAPGEPRRDWFVSGEDGGEVDPECLGQMAYDASWLLVEGREDIVGEFGATLHIDLEEGWRAGGWGRRLIERFVESVREVWEKEGGLGGGKGRGVHVGIAGENGKVVGFYERCGFVMLGERDGTIWMGRKI